MFLNSIITNPLEDEKLYEYVQDTFISIIENSVYQFLDEDDDVKRKKEILESVFPVSFLDRNLDKAMQIIKDLYEIAKSKFTREELPPLHLYAMHQMIGMEEDFRDELIEDDGDLLTIEIEDHGEIYTEKETKYENEIRNYLSTKYNKDTVEEYMNWFKSGIWDDFIDFYNDEYLYLDLWERRFDELLMDPDNIKGTSVILEEMIELMPNDIRFRWNKLKIEKNLKYITSNQCDSLLETLKTFKRKTESDFYRSFKITKTQYEETGRTLLQAFLNSTSFREAGIAAGSCDLILPNEETIIETKMWKGKEYYSNGLVELEQYLVSQKYAYGYMVVFYSTKERPCVLKNNNEDNFDLILDKVTISCIFININPVAPSKKRQSMLK